ncbi:hypothetical protein MIND_01146900 [Mycena indigotica]|uniref:Uncharacterized protein n=1 Tax=Mycena indigotica TaxID=2126181 RepID=A0A8H6S8B1_9AGAR|nr:uncharacterized protein MIND_01143100 [Mycena indigotica]XP_037215832.1 uncharacterized protein MIND_01146900 [Mycena indigotica]KAF7293637.1 hypothetical protein MIND_01143100 [Mycena indigotica]KAF7293669.1 hypothetical protein MIND_01146900 [Mycena indigotica]
MAPTSSPDSVDSAAFPGFKKRAPSIQTPSPGTPSGADQSLFTSATDGSQSSNIASSPLGPLRLQAVDNNPFIRANNNGRTDLQQQQALLNGYHALKIDHARLETEVERLLMTKHVLQENAVESLAANVKLNAEMTELKEQLAEGEELMDQQKDKEAGLRAKIFEARKGREHMLAQLVAIRKELSSEKRERQRRMEQSEKGVSKAKLKIVSLVKDLQNLIDVIDEVEEKLDDSDQRDISMRSGWVDTSLLDAADMSY